MQRVTVKSGQTFSRDAAFINLGNPNTPQSTLGLEISSTLRKINGQVIQQFSITRVDEPLGLFKINASASETLSWPCGLLLWDIVITNPATTATLRTDVLELNVIEAII